MLRQLHGFSLQFESVIGIRAKLIEKFKDHVPNSVSFDVGYFEGQQHSKVWLCSDDDLQGMYAKYPRGEITLWCEGKEEQSIGHRKHKREESFASKRQEKEADVESVFIELQEKHGDNFDVPRLRLWARMVACRYGFSSEHPCLQLHTKETKAK